MDVSRIVAALLAIEGLVWLLAGLFDWDFFIRLLRGIPQLAALDRRMARLLLAAGGAVLAVGGALFALGFV